jgi:Rod binding domain-containing protein
MNVPSISSAGVTGDASASSKADKTGEAAQNFEAILLRQFLSESMKSLLQDGPGGQVYGYLLTETLADSMAKAGGLGLSSMLQTQFSKNPHQ